VAINPVLITNDAEVKTLHYYVIFSNSNEVYEWTYFQPKEIANGNHFGEAVVAQINTLTEWNFSYDNLDDENFWQKYVLLKEGGKFKFLKKIK
jgi:hypothetical protein